MLTEHTQQGEEVIVVMKEPGIPPSDMQCAAVNTRGNRHKEDIYWDEDLQVWSSLCEKHTKQNNDARQNKAKKVALYQE